MERGRGEESEDHPKVKVGTTAKFISTHRGGRSSVTSSVIVLGSQRLELHIPAAERRVEHNGDSCWSSLRRTFYMYHSIGGAQGCHKAGGWCLIAGENIHAGANLKKKGPISR